MTTSPPGQVAQRRTICRSPTRTTAGSWTGDRDTTVCEPSSPLAGSPSTHPVVRALGDRKDEYFRESVKDHGVRVFDGTLVLLRSLRAAALASRSSLPVATALRCLRLRVSTTFSTFASTGRCRRARPAWQAGPRGVPGGGAPPTGPNRAVVVEDALAGVAAGRRGGFVWS